jgi:hypothetical protein
MKFETGVKMKFETGVRNADSRGHRLLDPIPPCLAAGGPAGASESRRARYRSCRGRYVYGNWSAAEDCSDLAFSPFKFPETVPQHQEIDWNVPNFKEPLTTLYTVQNGYDFEDPTCGEMAFICYPSIGPSSIDFYPVDGGIPGWGNSLLVTTLKNGALYRFKLNGGAPGIRDADQVFRTVNRYRDLALSPDARPSTSPPTAGALRAMPRAAPPTSWQTPERSSSSSMLDRTGREPLRRSEPAMRYEPAAKSVT